MITKVVTQEFEYFQFEGVGFCFLAFDLDSLLSSLPANLIKLCLTQLN
jgi:hypothetical protein